MKNLLGIYFCIFVAHLIWDAASTLQTITCLALISSGVIGIIQSFCAGKVRHEEWLLFYLSPIIFEVLPLSCAHLVSINTLNVFWFALMYSICHCCGNVSMMAACKYNIHAFWNCTATTDGEWNLSHTMLMDACFSSEALEELMYLWVLHSWKNSLSFALVAAFPFRINPWGFWHCTFKDTPSPLWLPG